MIYYFRWEKIIEILVLHCFIHESICPETWVSIFSPDQKVKILIPVNFFLYFGVYLHCRLEEVNLCSQESKKSFSYTLLLYSKKCCGLNNNTPFKYPASEVLWKLLSVKYLLGLFKVDQTRE